MASGDFSEAYDVKNILGVIKMNNSRSFFRTHLATIVMCIMMLYSTMLPATASAANTITSVMCVATNQLTGPIGRVIAVVVIASLAISLFLGKVSWGLAIATMVGMGVLFGAPALVNLLSAGNAAIC